MKPLLFLYVRILFNGIKRAVSSPTRILGLLFFIVLQFNWLGRAIFRGSATGLEALPMDKFKFSLPPVTVIECGIFGLLSFFSLFYVFSLANTRATFRAADVDVLFPTPLSPSVVLFFRVLRDIWLSLLLPLFFALLAWKPAKIGWANLFSNVKNPAMANTVLQVGIVTYLLTAIAWVWIGHASTLALSKPDKKTDRIRAGLTWVMALTYLGILGYIYLRCTYGTLPNVLIDIAHETQIRVAFFMAHFGSSLTIAPLSGNWVNGLAGLAGLIATSVVAILVACRSTGWFYENAALRTNVTEATQKLRKSGDMMGMAVSRAQSGKLKAGKEGWIQRQTVRGPLAIIWKEIIIRRRTTRWATYWMIVTSISVTVAACFIPPSNKFGDISGIMLLFFQSTVVLSTSMGLAQAGFIESLRRIDLLKPIPFKTSTIILCEVLSKAYGSWMGVTVGLLSALVIKPSLVQYVFGGILMFPTMTLALSSVSLLLVLLLPDVEDPTQRGFRGLATMLGMLAVGGPPVVVFGGLVYLKIPVLLAAIPATLLMGVITWLCALSAGRVYESFNPAD